MSRLMLMIGLVLVAGSAWAQTGFEALSVTTNANGSQTYTLTLQILLLMTALTVLPSLLLAMTAFTRIIIVLAILRQALGTAQTPSSQILLALALFMTAFIMTPVTDRMYADAVTPYLNDKIDLPTAFQAAQSPVRDFMLAQTRESDLKLFVDMSHHAAIAEPKDTPFTLLLPAFVTSELKTGFQIGFLIFIPFLVIDLVVASLLMSLGMMMLSPLIISLPFKIMLFVLVDGWALVVGSLAASFYV